MKDETQPVCPPGARALSAVGGGGPAEAKQTNPGPSLNWHLAGCLDLNPLPSEAPGLTGETESPAQWPVATRTGSCLYVCLQGEESKLLSF